MAKPIGTKTRVIREGIRANPDMGNTELARLLSGQNEAAGIDIRPSDIAAQRQALKKLAAEGGDEGEESPGGTAAVAPGGEAASTPVAPPKMTPAPPAAPVAGSGLNAADLVALAGLVKKAGSVEALVEILRALEQLRGY
jgi:hypothetical protein